MIFTFSYNSCNNIKSIIVEQIDDLELIHEFNSAEEAKEFADVLIRNKPIANKYTVMFKNKLGMKPILLYNGTGNKNTRVTADNLLSNS